MTARLSLYSFKCLVDIFLKLILLIQPKESVGEERTFFTDDKIRSFR